MGQEEHSAGPEKHPEQCLLLRSQSLNRKQVDRKAEIIFSYGKTKVKSEKHLSQEMLIYDNMGGCQKIYSKLSSL